jgi:acetolactate synthase I/II/III large subunit
MATSTLSSTSGIPTVPREQQSRSGAQAIVEALQACDVDMVFGYSGGGTGALIHQIATSGLANMNGRTEIAGAWMSYGYNRVKGRAASACVFHCVGMLHTAPVVYAAKVDSTPLFVMDVNLDSALDLREGLQDSHDIYPALKVLSKYSRKVVLADDLPLAVRQSVLVASSGRPGPSVLDLGFQVLINNTRCAVEPLRLPKPAAADEDTIAEILAMIQNAKNPILLAGAGVHIAGAGRELQELAELLGLPVVSTSWGGRGLLSDDHPQFAGVLGSFGWVSANDMAQRSDLWIAVGTTFSQMTTGAWNLVKPSRVIQIDVDPGELGKIFQPTLGVAGHAKVVLQQLIRAVRRSGQVQVADESKLAAIAQAKKEWHEYHDSLSRESGTPINQYYLIRQMAETFPAGTIMVGDSGGQAFMLYRSFRYREPTPMALGSRYMSLGAGLPVAIGAKLAAPDRTVVSYHGDGGFYYDFAELSTLAERGIKVIVVIDNNHCLYANRQGMRLWGIQNPWVDLPQTTDFVALAKSLGVEAEQVLQPGDIRGALQRALAAKGSYVIDVVTDPETRIRRAIRDVIPILTDRKPEQGADRHMSPPLEGGWPN